MSRAALLIDDGTAGYVLPAARSLAAAGWTVGLGSSAPSMRTRGSRAIRHRHVVPRPDEDLDAFVAGINAAVAAEGYDVLIPADDVEMIAMSATRDRLDAIVPYGDHASVMRAVDKLELARLAQETGMAVPHTEIATPASIDACDLPVMVKSRLHWAPDMSGRVRGLLVQRLDDRGDVARRVAEIEAAGGSALLQQPLTGRQIAMSVVADRTGDIVAVSAQTTLGFSMRGPSTRAVTIDADPALVDEIGALVQRIGWRGLANLQFYEPEGGRPHLIDWNGRLYGSLALAVAAGVALPAIWAGCALGDPPPAPSTARVGVRFQELEQDLHRARFERDPSLVRDLVRTLAFAPGAAHTVWSVRDPVPAIRWGATLLRHAVTRGGRERGSDGFRR